MKTIRCSPIGQKSLSWIVLIVLLLPMTMRGQSGCTDIQANNFDPIAAINDGSCLYATTIAQPEFSVPLNAAVKETSGLFSWNEQWWTFNDDTNGHFYALDTLTGQIIDSIDWSVLTNVDWEEVQCNEEFVVIGDIGNNQGSRTDLKFFVIPYNTFASGDLSVVDTISFSYQDQTDWTPNLNNNDFDAEAFLLTQDSIFIFSKCWISMQTKRYALPIEMGEHVAQKREEYNVQGLITGATWDDLKQKVVLCGYSNLLMPFALLLFDYGDGYFFNGNKRKIVLGMGLHQVEAVASNGHGDFFFTNEFFNGIVAVSAAFHRGWSITSWVTNLDEVVKFDQAPFIYPNPVSDLLNIELGSIHIAWRFEIFDDKGLMLDKGRSWGKQLTYDVSALAPGVYTIRLLKGNQYYPCRFIKQR